MFTGIVQGMGPIASVQGDADLRSFVVELPAALGDGLAIGASVALDGVCMTVTAQTGNLVHFDAMRETLEQTTLGRRVAGDQVNIERSFVHGAEVGGHILSGHIDCIAEIVEVEITPENRMVTYALPPHLSRYVFRKGFVAVDGCSLTVVDVDQERHCFRISYIPETLRSTLHAQRVQGDVVNIEIDRQTQVIVDTVERVLAQRSLNAGA